METFPVVHSRVEPVRGASAVVSPTTCEASFQLAVAPRVKNTAPPCSKSCPGTPMTATPLLTASVPPKPAPGSRLGMPSFVAAVDEDCAGRAVARGTDEGGVTAHQQRRAEAGAARRPPSGGGDADLHLPGCGGRIAAVHVHGAGAAVGAGAADQEPVAVEGDGRTEGLIGRRVGGGQRRLGGPGPAASAKDVHGAATLLARARDVGSITRSGQGDRGAEAVLGPGVGGGEAARLAPRPGGG